MIEAWSDTYDEIDELKKLFLQFYKRWLENAGRGTEGINAPVIYKRKRKNREAFSLTQNSEYIQSSNESTPLFKRKDHKKSRRFMGDISTPYVAINERNYPKTEETQLNISSKDISKYF